VATWLITNPNLLSKHSIAASTICAIYNAERDLVSSDKQAGLYAGEHGVRLTVESWNRYENYFINRMEQSLELVNLVNLENVGCMGDTYHMNIEETDIAAAIRMAGDKLYHLHIADSNRAAPMSYLKWLARIQRISKRWKWFAGEGRWSLTAQLRPIRR
jgi:sugar phosphate isomerase/epimerase